MSTRSLRGSHGRAFRGGRYLPVGWPGVGISARSGLEEVVHKPSAIFRHLRGRAQTGQRKRSAREATIRRGTSPSTTGRKAEGKAEDWIFPHSGANCPHACAIHARLRAASSTQPAQRAAQSCVMPPDRANTARPRRVSLAPVILNRERIRPGLTTQAGLSRKLGPCLPKKTRPIAPACERPRHRPRGTGHAPYRGRGGRAGAAVTANPAFTN